MKISIPEIRKLFKKMFSWCINNSHWILTIFITLYTIVPILSPIFLKLGLERPGWWIQTIYRVFCHQRPERSVFLFGSKFTYSYKELIDNGYWVSFFGYPFVGNETIGYKIAFCSRDLFLYGALSISGIFVSIFPKKVDTPWWISILLISPMLLDGTIQFLSELAFITQNSLGIELAKPFYLSNNLTRAITGGLFGIGVGLFIFSQIKPTKYEPKNK